MESSNDNGGTAILRAELGSIFDSILTPAGVTSRIEALENKNLVHRGRLKDIEKAKMYGQRGGPKSVVFISQHGINNLETFNRRINDLFLGVTGNVQKTFLRSFLAVVRKMASGGLALIESRKGS